LKKEKLVEAVGGMRIMDDVGIKVHKLKGLKLHAKLLFADGVRAIIGSINLAPGSFDSRRELAIEVRDQEVMDRLHSVVHQDWKNSRPLDLTDSVLPDFDPRELTEYYFDLVQTTAAEDADLTRQFPEQFRYSQSLNRIAGRRAPLSGAD
jgi:phosphatidylserine/phosphatidylglycerophosphate/cardiolipin synthase-like enzyme